MANISLTPHLKRYCHLGLLLLICYLGACARSEAESPKNATGKQRAIPVLTATATEQNHPLLVDGTGTVEAYATVAVKSRTSGELTGVYFQEGENVHQGELLFKIDARSQLSSLNQAEANREKALSAVSQAQANLQKALAGVQQAQANRQKALAGVQQAQANRQKALAGVTQAKANQQKNLAQTANTSVRAQRYQQLMEQGAISKDQSELLSTQALTDEATLNASQSEVKNAQAGVQASQAEIETAQAAVLSAQAEIETAQAAVLATQAEVQNAQAVVEAAEGEVKNAQAGVRVAQTQIDQAKIDLSYTSIVAPIDGRTGNLKVNTGNLIKENDTNPLVIISQTQPIYVSFTVPQRLLPEVKKYMTQKGSLPVEAVIPKDEERPERGEITFVDSTIDKTTGTLQLKGTFENKNNRLWPGQFVKVVLKLSEDNRGITVPTVAVQTGQKGPFVFVVNADQTAELRPVQVGSTLGKDTLIKEGLKSGEVVVIDGQFNLVPHAKVQVKK